MITYQVHWLAELQASYYVAIRLLLIALQTLHRLSHRDLRWESNDG